jgi:large subunit ribosomal protein L18
MKKVEEKLKRRDRRKKHIRKIVSGTLERPRLTIFKSNKHIYLQLVDDLEGKTLAAVSTMEKDCKLGNNVADAEKLGLMMGEKIRKIKIDKIVFDRNGYIYHGVVKAAAEGARKAGIQF